MQTDRPYFLIVLDGLSANSNRGLRIVRKRIANGECQFIRVGKQCYPVEPSCPTFGRLGHALQTQDPIVHIRRTGWVQTTTES